MSANEESQAQAKEAFITVRVDDRFKAAATAFAQLRHELGRDLGPDAGPAKPELGEYVRWLIGRDMANAEREIIARRNI